MSSPVTRAPVIALPAASALAVGLRRAALVGEDGEIVDLTPREVAARIDGRAPLVVHLPSAARRLGMERFPAHDLLEL
jgi:ATP-dependent DNA helicase DinG